HLGEQGLGLLGQGAVLDIVDGDLDRVLDALDLDAGVLDDGVRGARVAVARLADTAGVDNELVPDLEYVGQGRVAYTDHVGLDPLQPALPELRLAGGVLVERVTRRSMNEQETRVVQREHLADGQPAQVAALVGSQAFLGQLPGYAREVFEAVAT